MARGPSRHDFTAEADGERTVLRAVVGADGTFTLANGDPLPKLRPGMAVEMRLNLAAIDSREERREYRRPDQQELLLPHARLYMLIDAESLGDSNLVAQLRAEGLLEVLERGLERGDQIRRSLREGSGGEDVSRAFDRWRCVLEVRTREAVVVERKGMKLGRLLRCACTVEGLPPDSARLRSQFGTLNHALTAMSERLEMHRAAHGGNAFLRYVWLDEGKPRRWYRLDDLRARLSRNEIATDFARGREAVAALAERAAD